MLLGSEPSAHGICCGSREMMSCPLPSCLLWGEIPMPFEVTELICVDCGFRNTNHSVSIHRQTDQPRDVQTLAYDSKINKEQNADKYSTRNEPGEHYAECRELVRGGARA